MSFCMRRTIPLSLPSGLRSRATTRDRKICSAFGLASMKASSGMNCVLILTVHLLGTYASPQRLAPWTSVSLRRCEPDDYLFDSISAPNFPQRSLRSSPELQLHMQLDAGSSSDPAYSPPSERGS